MSARAIAMTILVAEDDPDDRALARDAFAEARVVGLLPGPDRLSLARLGHASAERLGLGADLDGHVGVEVRGRVLHLVEELLTHGVERDPTTRPGRLGDDERSVGFELADREADRCGIEAVPPIAGVVAAGDLPGALEEVPAGDAGGEAVPVVGRPSELVDERGEEQRCVGDATADHDVGTALDPSIIEAQMFSGAILGLSAAMGQAITFKDGMVEQSNFHDFDAMRIFQAPVFEVAVLENYHKMGGVGEVGVPPAAPALANAIFALTGKRVRSLPLSNEVKFV